MQEYKTLLSPNKIEWFHINLFHPTNLKTVPQFLIMIMITHKEY